MRIRMERFLLVWVGGAREQVRAGIWQTARHDTNRRNQGGRLVSAIFRVYA